jgi:tRNA 2-thiouridine synthesizing protein A
MFTVNKELDTRFLNPPHPVLRTLRAMDSLESGQVLKLTTTERNAIRSMENLCRQTGLVLMQYMDWGGEYTFFIRKNGESVTDCVVSEICPAGWQRPDAHFDSALPDRRSPRHCHVIDPSNPG